MLTNFYHTIDALAADIKLNKQKKTIYVGDTYKLKLNGVSEDEKITWKSSNEKVASVDKYGKVTANKKGKTTITATYKKKVYQCSIKVKKKAIYDTLIKYIKKNDQNKGKDSLYGFSFDIENNISCSIMYHEKESDILFVTDNGDQVCYIHFYPDSPNKIRIIYKNAQATGYGDYDKDNFTIDDLKWDFIYSDEGYSKNEVLKNFWDEKYCEIANGMTKATFILLNYTISQTDLTLKDLGFAKLNKQDLE